jgi:hypothetical protein
MKQERKEFYSWAEIAQVAWFQPGSEHQKAIGGMQTRGGGTNGKKQILSKSSRGA